MRILRSLSSAVTQKEYPNSKLLKTSLVSNTSVFLLMEVKSISSGKNSLSKTFGETTISCATMQIHGTFLPFLLLPVTTCLEDLVSCEITTKLREKTDFQSEYVCSGPVVLKTFWSTLEKKLQPCGRMVS